MALEDSSQILINDGNSAILISPPESLAADKYFVKYAALDSEANAYFKLNANQQVISSLNPDIIQYFNVNKNNVLLAGYALNIQRRTYTIFNPPLIIASGNLGKVITTTGEMKIFDSQNDSLKSGLKVKLQLTEIKKINLKTNRNKTTPCKLLRITLSRDVRYAYGKNKLILPDAIMIQSYVLVNEKGVPAAEWSVKPGRVDSNLKKKRWGKHDYFIEFIKYSKNRGE